MRRFKTGVVCVGTCLALFALPVLAIDVVESGPDMWITSGKGYTYTSFESDPIPADFFCPGSPAFAGKVAMHGAPLATEPPGVLGHVDTIVLRMDNAEFDENGVANTRIRMLALSLANIEPIDVGCGTPFDLTANLDGEQPITEMKIVREVENGGSYVAPLALEVKLSFIPQNGGETRELHRRIDLGPGTNSVWTTANGGRMMADGRPVRIDTNGDQVADTALPKLSKFVAGVAPVATTIGIGVLEPEEEYIIIAPQPLCPRGTCPYRSCHCKPQNSYPPPQWNQPNSGCDPVHMHCVDTCAPCDVVLGDIEPTLGQL